MGTTPFGTNPLGSGSGVDASVRTSLLNLTVTFKDNNGSPVAVSSPVGQLFLDGRPVSVEALDTAEQEDHSYPLLPVTPPVVGMYKWTFLSTRMQAGIYRVEFRGTAPLNGVDHGLLVQGDLGIGEITHIQDLVNRVRMGLMDDFPEEYRLDEPVYQWTAQQIYTYLREACDRINNTGPRRDGFILDYFPAEIDEFLVTGAKIWALYARSRLEKANEMSYSDQHTLTIARAEFYRTLADGLYRDWLAAIMSWKKATPPTPIGMKSQRLPFRIFRVLGLMPNYQSYFSG